MMSVNRVTLIGNLGADPESRKTAAGHSLTSFRIATTNSWTNREGQRQEHTEWHRIVVWGKQADTCAEYLSKGRRVYIEGRLQTRSWEDEKGSRRYTTEVVAGQVLFLDSAADRQQPVSSGRGAGRKSAPAAAEQQGSYQKEPAFGGEAESHQEGPSSPAADNIPF